MFDRFRGEYNEQRPHQALGMHAPSLLYEPSPRFFPARMPESEYAIAMLVCSVHPHGHIR
jgi:transposase InsO family protein